MPDNPLDDQLKQQAHADQIRQEREKMDRERITREQARARIEEERNKPVAAAPVAQELPMIAMPPLKLDKNVLSLDFQAGGPGDTEANLIAGNRDGRPAVFSGPFSFVRFL